MSVTNIPDSVKYMLWGKAAGRCEFEGCNKPLWFDLATACEFNNAYIAHIIADQPKGPRGDPQLSFELQSDISNLMLLCDSHHRLIDKQDVEKYTIEILQKMKIDHETRVELSTDYSKCKRSHILLYGANIGSNTGSVSFNKARESMFPSWYPAEPKPITISLINSSIQDHTQTFWDTEAQHLKTTYQQQVKERIALGQIERISVFALAPQPLLILLGTLISDITYAEIYQPHREPQNWNWQDSDEEMVYKIKKPNSTEGEIALVFSLSGNITTDRINKVLGEKASIWQFTIENPNNDFLQSRNQLVTFRKQIRNLLNEIKAVNPQRESIHIFPAMPVATAIELGRVYMPKADLRLRIYDQNKKRDGFFLALEI